MKKPKIAADGRTDSFFDEGEIYTMMQAAEEAREAYRNKVRKHLNTEHPGCPAEFKVRPK